jgi:hypothetical protein
MRFIRALMNIRSVLSKYMSVTAVPAVSEQAGEIVCRCWIGEI